MNAIAQHLAPRPTTTAPRGSGTALDRATAQTRRALTVFGVLAVILLPVVLRAAGKPAYMSTAVLALIVALSALSLVVLLGYVGQLSLAQFAFMGIGALVVSRLAPVIGFWTALPLAGVLAVPAGLVAAVPALRLRGIYLAVATLGFGQVITAAVLLNPKIAGGAQIHLDTPTLGGLTFPGNLVGRFDLYYVVLAILAVFVLFTLALRTRKTGHAFTAVRDSEVAAASIGINVTRYKLLAFGLSAFYAGIAGGLYMVLNSDVDPGSFDPLSGSIPLLIVLVIGGVGSVGGAIIAGFLYAMGPLILPPVIGGLVEKAHLPFANPADLTLALFGAGLLVGLVFSPQGIVGGLDQKIRRVYSLLGGRPAPSTVAAAGVDSEEIELRGTPDAAASAAAPAKEH